MLEDGGSATKQPVELRPSLLPYPTPPPPSRLPRLSEALFLPCAPPLLVHLAWYARVEPEHPPATVSVRRLSLHAMAPCSRVDFPFPILPSPSSSRQPAASLPRFVVVPPHHSLRQHRAVFFVITGSFPPPPQRDAPQNAAQWNCSGPGRNPILPARHEDGCVAITTARPCPRETNELRERLLQDRLVRAGPVATPDRFPCPPSHPYHPGNTPVHTYTNPSR